MNEELNLETYLNVSPTKFGIYLLDTKNFKNLYKQELEFHSNVNSIDFDILKKFLDENIFKVEKIGKKFVENIYLIIDNNKNFNLQLGIKKKNHSFSITKEYLQNALIDAKDLFKENYQNHRIMHMIITKYFINNKTYKTYEDNLKSDHLNIEIEFKCISNSVIHDLNKILQAYQVKIIKCLDANYIKTFPDIDIELSQIAHKILMGYNQNEVKVVPKNPEKKGFFEKFFQLFS